MKLNWNFLGGRGTVQNKKRFVGGVWIFPGTAQCILLPVSLTGLHDVLNTCSKNCVLIDAQIVVLLQVSMTCPREGTPYNGLYGEAPPERGTFFTLQVNETVGMSQVEVYERVGKSVI